MLDPTDWTCEKCGQKFSEIGVKVEEQVSYRLHPGGDKTEFTADDFMGGYSCPECGQELDDEDGRELVEYLTEGVFEK